jgi:anti-sigma B factor antagonist
MNERTTMHGRITIDNAGEMRLLLAEAIRSQGDRVVVDISQVTYMDTSALATLLEALRIAHKSRKRLVLRGIQEQPRCLFEATELDHVFEIEQIGDL